MNCPKCQGAVVAETDREVLAIFPRAVKCVMCSWTWNGRGPMTIQGQAISTVDALRSTAQSLAMQPPFEKPKPKPVPKKETRRCERLKGSGHCRSTAVRALNTGQHQRWFCEPCAAEVEGLIRGVKQK